ncbi:MAG: hypothetical protein HRT68_10285 [Flavobacteriaceae bacterium]|nr:hypothetical protein [Flavobacteriaceae bacterium]
MKLEQIKDRWFSLIGKDDVISKNSLEAILKHYQDEARYYHNIRHIDSMLSQAKTYPDQLNDVVSVEFAIWYHDVIYNAKLQDNEEKSADYAVNDMSQLGCSSEVIAKTKQLILSTKKHQILLNENQDNAFLLDFDLSILGKSWEVYYEYTEAIRREYSMYPKSVYNPGRKKVLKRFMERERIYFTELYCNQFESKARENIKREIDLL